MFRSTFHATKPWLWLFLLWWAGSVVLSSLSGEQLKTVPFEWNDKLAHIVYFGTGGWLLARTLAKAGFASGIVWIVTPLVIALVSAIDETYQLVTPGRSGADIFDFIADCIGGVLGIAIARLQQRRCGAGLGAKRPPASDR